MFYSITNNNGNYFIPNITLGYYHNGSSVEEKMIVCEEDDNFVGFVKNIIPHNQNVTRRSFYMIIRPKVSYLYLRNNKIYNNLNEFLREKENKDFMSNYLIFNDSKIYLQSNGVELIPDLYNILKYLPLEVSDLFSYYILDENIKYFHVCINISSIYLPDDFNKSELIKQMYNYCINNNINFTEYLINYNFVDLQINKGTKRINYQTNPLSSLRNISDIQKKKYSLGVFMCEVFFDLISWIKTN